MARKAPVSHQSVCMSLRKSPAEQQQQRATTFHVCPVACSKCLFFVTSTPCPARRTHPAHAVFTLQTSRLGRISQSLRFYDSGMRKTNTMITALFQQDAHVFNPRQPSEPSKANRSGPRHQIDAIDLQTKKHTTATQPTYPAQALRHDPRLKTTWHRPPHLDPLCPRGLLASWKLGGREEVLLYRAVQAAEWHMPEPFWSRKHRVPLIIQPSRQGRQTALSFCLSLRKP